MTEHPPSNESPYPWTVDDDARLIRDYIRVGVPVDYLAYTPEFDSLYDGFVGSSGGASKAEVFRRLLSLRKRGQLPRLFKHREAGDHDSGAGESMAG